MVRVVVKSKFLPSVIEGVVCPVKKGSGGSAGHEALLPSLAIQCQLLSHAARKADRGSAGHEASLPSLTMHCQSCRCRRRRRRGDASDDDADDGSWGLRRWRTADVASPRRVCDVERSPRCIRKRTQKIVSNTLPGTTCGLLVRVLVKSKFLPITATKVFSLGAGGQQRGGTPKCLQQLH